MSLISVTGYWYPNQSTEMLPPEKPIRSPRILTQDILDEINEVHPFSKDPFLIGKVKNYVHTKKDYECSPSNQMGALFYRKCKKAVSNHIILQPEVFKLGEEDFKLASRDLRGYLSRTKVPSQDCYVFGEQAIINSVGERLREQSRVKKLVKIDEHSKNLKRNEYKAFKIKPTNKAANASNDESKTNESKLHRSGIDGSWSFDKSDFKKSLGKTKCCDGKLSTKENEGTDEISPTRTCSSLKPQKLLGLGGKNNDYAYPICPRGTAAIILKTYSTYNIKWQFRAKYVTLGVQKKRKRKTKWSAREWAWFMRRRSKKMERKHLKKLLRKRQKQFANVEPTKKLSSESNTGMNKRRRASKVATKLQRLKTKLFRLKKKQKNKLTKITLLTKGLFSTKQLNPEEEDDAFEDDKSQEEMSVSEIIPEETQEKEKKLTEDPTVNVDKTVAAVKSFSKLSRGIPKIKTTKPKSFKAVKQDSMDSLPDLADIDVFDRNKTPDPKAPATLIHQLKNGDSSSESQNVIEKYYASKNEEKLEDAEEEEEEDINEYEERRLDKNSTFSAKVDENKRNSILFPDMSLEEIDARMLEICKNSEKWNCYVQSFQKMKAKDINFSLDIMLRGLLHPSDYKEILFRVSSQPKVTYGDEKCLKEQRRKLQEKRITELKKKIKAKKVSQKFGLQNKFAMAKDVITTVQALSTGAKEKHSASSMDENTVSNSLTKVKNVASAVTAFKQGATFD